MNLVQLPCAVLHDSRAGDRLALRRRTRNPLDGATSSALGVPVIYVAQPTRHGPGQMEGFLTYYYEYHFLYITGLNMWSPSRSRARADQAAVLPGHRHGERDGRDGFLRESRPRLYAARDGPAVRDALRCRQRGGRLSGLREQYPHGQPDPGSGAKHVRPLFATLPGVSAPPPFAAAPALSSFRWMPRSCRPTASRPRTWSVHRQRRDDQPSGNIDLGDKYPVVPLNSIVKDAQDLAAVAIRPGALPTLFVRDIGKVQDASDIQTASH